MNDVERAKSLLKKGGHTCVLCRGETVYTSCERGVAPLLRLLDNKNDLKGFSAADKVVGRAPALLYALMGVRAVYASVMTERADHILREHGIFTAWEVITQTIHNRAGTGVCPMELAVGEIEEPTKALEVIRRRVEELTTQRSMKDF